LEKLNVRGVEPEKVWVLWVSSVVQLLPSFEASNVHVFGARLLLEQVSV
jgi:hypothetical protein